MKRKNKKRNKLKSEQNNVIKELETVIGKEIPLIAPKESAKFGFKLINKNVVELTLYNQGLSILPESIGSLTSLKFLYLNNNQLSTLPESIGKLTSLEFLYFNNNQLSTLPESIGKLTSLKTLDLQDNKLTTLPESIGKLTSLETLDLQDNKLTTLPESIGKLTSLEFLNLIKNQLLILPDSFSNLISLRQLNLFDNKLITLPESILNNDIILEKINTNEIITSNCFSLDLIEKCEDIILKSNRIDKEILIDFKNNLENKLLYQGRKESKALISKKISLEKDSQIYIFKVILMGDGGTGKTTILIRYITDRFISDTQMTMGVGVYKKNEFISINRRDQIGDIIIIFQIWDFGGEERFRSLLPENFDGAQGAILCFDINRFASLKSVDDWMEMYQNCVKSKKIGEIPIILIGNKDDIKQDECNPDSIQHFVKKYNFHYFNTSAKTGKNIAETFQMLGTLILENLNIEPQKFIGTHSERKEFFEDFVKQIGKKDFSQLNNFITQINAPEFFFNDSIQFTNALRIIQLLETNLNLISNRDSAIKCISKLSDLISHYYYKENNISQYKEYKFKSFEYELNIKKNFDEQEKYKPIMSLVQWFWKNLNDLVNIDGWFKDFEDHKELYELCILEGDQLFYSAIQTYEAFKFKDIDLLEDCKNKFYKVKDLFPEESETLKLAEEAIKKIRNSLPIVRVVKYNFQPDPLIYDSPASFHVSLKNNTLKSQNFVLELTASGFENKKEEQTQKISSKEKIEVSYLLGKVNETIKMNLSVQFKIFDNNKKCIEAFLVSKPNVLLLSDLEQMSPTINSIETDNETIVLDKTATVIVRVKLINPTNNFRIVQLALDAPKFIISDNKPFPKRSIPPFTSEGSKDIIEYIYLGTPEIPNIYFIHLKLLDEKERVIPESDREILFSFKISKKKKIIQFIKGVTSITSITKIL